MRSIVIVCSLLVFAVGTHAQEKIDKQQCQNGDIVFIKNPAIVSAVEETNNRFNCAGIIFKEPQGLMVYYADEPLKKCALEDFLNLSTEKKYSIKRLVNADLLTKEAVESMHTFALAQTGTPYDKQENLDSEEFYNAEFIWKIYRSALGIHLCQPKEYSASADKKYASPGAGFSDTLSYKHISMRDLYRSELLE